MQNDPREMNTDDLEAAAVHAGHISNRRMRLLTAIFAIVAAAALAFSITGFVEARDSAQTGEQTAQQETRDIKLPADDLVNRVLEACKGDNPRAKGVRDAGLCGQASETKAQIKQVITRPARPGATGDRGPAGIAGALGLEGPRGLRGLPGGPGMNGSDGQTGAPGESIKGESGVDGKDGAAGKDGSDATNGKDAPTITNITCDATTGVFTFSNDSTIRVDNMCAAPLVPVPAP